jgi:hypothetical protein
MKNWEKKRGGGPSKKGKKKKKRCLLFAISCRKKQGGAWQPPVAPAPEHHAVKGLEGPFNEVIRLPGTFAHHPLGKTHVKHRD